MGSVHAPDGTLVFGDQVVPDLFRRLFVIGPDSAEILVRQVFVDAEIIGPVLGVQAGPLGIDGLEQGRHVFIGRPFGQVVFVDDLARMAGQRVRRYTGLGCISWISGLDLCGWLGWNRFGSLVGSQSGQGRAGAEQGGQDSLFPNFHDNTSFFILL